jgi:hypothetical protein
LQTLKLSYSPKAFGIKQMAAMLKQTLAVVSAALLSFQVWAAEPTLRDDHPEQYVVKKGDTLWDISGKFLNSPWYWPEIWQANPQIENPHLIYPGDVISLVYVDGKPRLVMSRGISGPRIRTSPLDDAAKTVPLSSVQQYLERPRLLDRDEILGAPYIVALEEDRNLGMNTQVAYVRNLKIDKPGTRFSIARASMVYREIPVKFPWSSGERKRVADPWEREGFDKIALPSIGGLLWRDWVYERNSELLGYEVMEVGTAEVVKGGDPATVYITYVDQEIRQGDMLLPPIARPFNLEFFPRAPRQIPEGTRILALNEAISSVGPGQVVVLNRGSSDGLEVGDTMSSFNVGATIRDEIAAARDDLRYTFRPGKAKVKLPNLYSGTVMVFRVFDKISYALVMEAVRPVRLGDVLDHPDNR